MGIKALALAANVAHSAALSHVVHVRLISETKTRPSFLILHGWDEDRTSYAARSFVFVDSLAQNDSMRAERTFVGSRPVRGEHAFFIMNKGVARKELVLQSSPVRRITLTDPTVTTQRTLNLLEQRIDWKVREERSNSVGCFYHHHSLDNNEQHYHRAAHVYVYAYIFVPPVSAECLLVD